MWVVANTPKNTGPWTRSTVAGTASNEASAEEASQKCVLIFALVGVSGSFWFVEVRNRRRWILDFPLSHDRIKMNHQNLSCFDVDYCTVTSVVLLPPTSNAQVSGRRDPVS
jgi:hypothetical protein